MRLLETIVKQVAAAARPYAVEISVADEPGATEVAIRGHRPDQCPVTVTVIDNQTVVLSVGLATCYDVQDDDEDVLAGEVMYVLRAALCGQLVEEVWLSMDGSPLASTLTIGRNGQRIHWSRGWRPKKRAVSKRTIEYAAYSEK